MQGRIIVLEVGHRKEDSFCSELFSELIFICFGNFNNCYVFIKRGFASRFIYPYFNGLYANVCSSKEVVGPGSRGRRRHDDPVSNPRVNCSCVGKGSPLACR